MAAGSAGRGDRAWVDFSIFGAFLGPAVSPTLASYPLQDQSGRALTVTVTQGATTVSGGFQYL